MIPFFFSRPTPMPGRVLLVDDDPQVRTSLSEALQDFGLAVETAGSGEAALSMVGGYRPDVVLSDIRMPGMDGIELLRLLKERMPDVYVVLITAFDDMPTVVSAMREGAFDFLVKPLNLDELEEVLKRALADRRVRERGRQEMEDQARSYRLNELVGRDPRMIGVFKLVGQLAATRVNVLVRGESGTGKELVARAIHFNSPWASEPFVPVNCTALPQTLLESELFGHVRGAFTGAHSDRRGRFVLAGKGTVFLDEIGDTSPEFQAKILRVLEEGLVYPVGAERPEKVEARVIAATHRDLEARVSEETFREDLYYRLRVAQVVIPSLRERRGDIPLLAEHLVGKAAERLHRPAPTVAAETLEALLAHDWPGNVRELENCLVRAIALSTGGVIRPEHLGLNPGPPASDSAFRSMDEVAAEHVRRVLEGVGGNKAKAARVLGISKPRLYRLIEKHGLE
ncbi:MAG TPA: sigma-54 dependent transcriptional regulator [Longimicrobiales bacterium]|nr:sigma-54 dependent transcriptional regulator [Longimicrobiales bacterium]